MVNEKEPFFRQQRYNNIEKRFKIKIIIIICDYELGSYGLIGEIHLHANTPRHVISFPSKSWR